MFGISFTGRGKSSKGSRASGRMLLEVEHLEDRLVPTVEYTGGHLLIYGEVLKTRYYTQEVNDNVRVDLVSGYYRVTQNGKVSSFAASTVTGQILFKGRGGDDVFYNNTNLTSYAYGEAGNDRLYGGPRTDYLYGGANNDYLYGGIGTDYVYGEDGNDTLIAGYDYSYNYMDGGNGDDILYGGWGGDRLCGRAGNDVIYGNAGNDHLSGGDGEDTLYGGTGNDLLRGENGYDFLYGEDGNDYLDGGYEGDNNQDDALSGGTGADTFVLHKSKDKSWFIFVDYVPPSDYARDFNSAEGDQFGAASS